MAGLKPASQRVEFRTFRSTDRAIATSIESESLFSENEKRGTVAIVAI